MTLGSISIVPGISNSFVFIEFPADGSAIVCVSSYLLMDSWVVPSFELLQIKCLGTVGSRS